MQVNKKIWTFLKYICRPLSLWLTHCEIFWSWMWIGWQMHQYSEKLQHLNDRLNRKLHYLIHKFVIKYENYVTKKVNRDQTALVTIKTPKWYNSLTQNRIRLNDLMTFWMFVATLTRWTNSHASRRCRQWHGAAYRGRYTVSDSLDMVWAKRDPSELRHDDK